MARMTVVVGMAMVVMSIIVVIAPTMTVNVVMIGIVKVYGAVMSTNKGIIARHVPHKSRTDVGGSKTQILSCAIDASVAQ